MADNAQESPSHEDNKGETDYITMLGGMDDAGLMKKMGLEDKLDEAKAAIQEMQGLTGKAREEAQERLKRMFEPSIYPGEMKYIVEDAKRAAKNGKDELCDCSPCSVC